MKRCSPKRTQAWCLTTGWRLHPGQLAALESWNRFGVIACGRRWGKTELAAAVAEANAFTYPGLYWVVGETFEVADLTLDACYVHLSRAPIKLVTRYSRAEHRIELVGGGVICAKSADHPEGLLGRGLSGVVFEEAAATPERMWGQFIRPALSDKRGWALFITSPRGRGNWIYRLATENQNEPEWSFRCSPSWENRHVFGGGRDDREIVAARAQYERMGMLPLWEQEFGGSFAHLQGRVYQAWSPSIHVAPLRRARDGCREFRLAIDWGHHHPCAILVIGKRDAGYSVVDEWYAAGKTPREIEDAALALAKKWDARRGWADPSQPGSILGMNNRGLAIESAFNDVTEGILCVAQALGRPDGMLIAQETCPNLIREAEDYCWRVTTTRDTEEPVKVRDDAVDAWRYGVASWDRIAHTGTTGDRYLISQPQETREMMWRRRFAQGKGVNDAS